MRFLLVAFFVLSACSHLPLGQDETQRFNKFLDDAFEEQVSFSPEFQTALGKKKNYSRLDDYTEAFAIKMRDWAEAKLVQMEQFDITKLDAQAQLSYQLLKKDIEDGRENFKWRDHGYSITQMYGIHTSLPTFMMNMHRVDNESDLHAYIARLNEFLRVSSEVSMNVRRSEKKGVIPPKFVYPYVIEASRNMIKGQPFDKSGKDSPLFADFKAKLANLKLSADKNEKYTKLAIMAFNDSVRPAYMNMMALFEAQAKKANNTAGVWKLPQGNEYYKAMVERHTTTTMTPDQIHKLGLENVARLQNDMRAVLKKIGWKGSLQAFFRHLRKDKKFYFENTPEGRKAYLDLSKKFYDEISLKVPQYFRLLPKSGFQIRSFEEFRQDSAGIAFYEQPSEDGSRPGYYYVNLKDMRNLPKHEAEVVLYHEGAPGHHFQIAIAQELQGLPQYRRFNHYTAYVEGWGLYTERLAKEMGAYKDDYSEFGRLSLELLRASRLVVDTGMHSKKWTREKAIKYMRDNLPGALEDQKNEIERYIVMPGQATAYMVGMLKIYELRENARKQLGDKFDIRDFHDVILGSGPLPLSELESLVKARMK